MLISQRWGRVHRLVMTTRDESNYKSYYKSVYLNSQKKKRKMKEITILFYLRVMTIPKNNNFDSFFSFMPIKKKGSNFNISIDLWNKSPIILILSNGEMRKSNKDPSIEKSNFNYPTPHVVHTSHNLHCKHVH